MGRCELCKPRIARRKVSYRPRVFRNCLRVFGPRYSSGEQKHRLRWWDQSKTQSWMCAGNLQGRSKRPYLVLGTPTHEYRTSFYESTKASRCTFVLWMCWTSFNRTEKFPHHLYRLCSTVWPVFLTCPNLWRHECLCLGSDALASESTNCASQSDKLASCTWTPCFSKSWMPWVWSQLSAFQTVWSTPNHTWVMALWCLKTPAPFLRLASLS